ncbi:MAG TPA: HAMP domain-containing sensor histidine kinase [Acidimicrobiia bacterium]|nr:HAMP domain-containing sensor histidine kinase [Acidimicrobiia bacterium]
MRRRLVALAATTTIMVALAFLIPLAVLVRTLARDRALSAAELEAQSLAPVLALTQDTTALEAAVRATNPGSRGRLVIILADNTQIGGPGPDADGDSSDAFDPTDPREADNLALARKGRSFSAPTRGGIEVLVPVALEADATAVVRVLVPDDVLSRGVAAAWAVEAALGLTLVASAVFVADRLARTIVRPVDALADAAGRLGEGDLSVRITPEGPPEVKQVAVAFNQLGDRVGELLEAERELVADLSHRLRTPLTVLRLDAEGLGDPEESRRLADDIDELERAVTGVIRQARKPVQHDVVASATDAAGVAEARLAFWAPLAEDQERPFELVRVGPEGEEGPLGSTTVPVSADELEAALDALLGNVFAHTDEGTAFRVEVRALSNGGISLAVEDSGPGLSPDFVERGVSGAGGTGLGLDIARRTAEGAGGVFRIGRSAAGGARIAMELPTTGPQPERSPR